MGKLQFYVQTKLHQLFIKGGVSVEEGGGHGHEAVSWWASLRAEWLWGQEQGEFQTRIILFTLVTAAQEQSSENCWCPMLHTLFFMIILHQRELL